MNLSSGSTFLFFGFTGFSGRREVVLEETIRSGGLECVAWVSYLRKLAAFQFLSFRGA